MKDSELDDPALLANAAAEIYGMRRARDRVMPSGLVGEPAWDILLALYSEEPGKLTLTSLSHGAAVPPTTILRWIGALEAEGFVERSEPPKGGSLALVSLTKKGCEIVERCLKAMLRVSRD